MLTRLLERFRSESLRDQVEASIRSGTGLRNGEWLASEGLRSPQARAALAERIVAWCQEEIARTRRPYGIDQLALAVACAQPGGQAIASATFGVFRPVDFYAADGVADRVRAFVTAMDPDALDRPVRFAAALFSWGDVARDTVYRDDPTSPPAASPSA
jgi:hypothetical protein